MAIVFVFAASLVAIALYFLNEFILRRGAKRLPLPPGPKGLPLVGNIKDLPPPGSTECLHWLQYKDVYGPINSFTVLGQTIITIHDRDTASELMDKRSTIHSGRHDMKFVNMCGWGDLMGAQSLNDSFKAQRKLISQQIGSKASVSRFWPLQERVVGRFLWRANKDHGQNLEQHIKIDAAELILKAIYGYTTEAHKADPLVGLIDQVMEEFTQAFVPGAWAVDLIPALKYVPDWFPGTGWKQTAKLFKKNFIQATQIPYDYARLHHSGENDISLVSKALAQQNEEKGGLSENESNMLKWAAVSLYTGGSDTTVSTMQAFFLAMAMYPDVQAKAHAELDTLLGSTPNRLPTFTDRSRLPYLSLIVEEAQRWHPVAPMGLPHKSSKEDTINGYRIPKGAILMPALWWFTRDPKSYHDPETFKPERFEEPYNEPLATQMTFGYGRRKCPGYIFADASLFLIFAQALSVFDIKPGVDEDGTELKLTHGFLNGVIGRPTPFKVRLLPRSEAHEKLIARNIEEHGWEESGAEVIRGMMDEQV